MDPVSVAREFLAAALALTGVLADVEVSVRGGLLRCDLRAVDADRASLARERQTLKHLVIRVLHGEGFNVRVVVVVSGRADDGRDHGDLSDGRLAARPGFVRFAPVGESNVRPRPRREAKILGFISLPEWPAVQPKARRKKRVKKPPPAPAIRDRSMGFTTPPGGK